MVGLTGPLWIFSYFLRSVHLVYTYYINQARLKLNTENSPLRLNQIEIFIFRLFAERRELKTTTTKSIIPESQVSNPEMAVNAKNSSGISIQVLRKILLNFIIIQFIVTIIAIAVNSTNLSSSCASPMVFLPTLVLIVLILVGIPFFLYLIRNTKDRLWVRGEIVMSMTAFGIIYVIYLLSSLLSSLRFLRLPGGTGTWVVIASILTFCITVVTPLYLSFFPQKISTSRDTDISFDKVLENPEYFEMLKIELAGSFCMENGLYWEAYKKLKSEYVPEKIKKQCWYIQKHFIETDSPYQLNLPADVIGKVTKNMQESKFSEETFAPVTKEVYNMMAMNTYPLFLQKYRKEIENHI
ncbi:regulator of G protein signaling superfamily [Rozella allomycis CSF55]|uniref:Regulator of G protein signaling superfamily n=1 Tax=Rozella allomycis (strain CSF55) TaxID=988480 RepID=A0A075B1Q7_ROZAC|nr:hypothetical protein O9G_003451 [Rozella allomycis CSF55]RKP18668.1 regulator of G protein signaling superfamily [Rozella allomycis CSF55]|eukprot:EPZ36293.1 hypothetical protein O9G_003451 [Rozella allomycis CSF55]